MHNIIPNESLVGVLFNQENLDVVKSSEVGIMQHAANTWQVEDDRFVRTTKSALSDNLDKAIYDWLFNYDLETRKLIIDETFGLLEKSNIKRVSDISENYLKSLFEDPNILQTEKFAIAVSFKIPIMYKFFRILKDPSMFGIYLRGKL